MGIIVLLEGLLDTPGSSLGFSDANTFFLLALSGIWSSLGD